MQHLELQQIKKMIEGTTLFEIDSLIANQGDRIGIVGANGSGKSTLLKMIIGEDKNYQGTVKVLSEFSYIPQLKELSQQSGGEQVKHYLNDIFAKRKPLLLLDEPTANLDLDNIKWLIKRLKRYSGTVIAVSHDRDFLDQIAKKIWHFDQSKVDEYHGNYSDFDEQLQQTRQQAINDYQNYQAKVQQLEKAAEAKMQQSQTFKKRKKNISSSDWKVNARFGSYDSQEKAIAQTGKALQRRIDQMDVVEKPASETIIRLKMTGNLDDSLRTLINLEAGKVQIDNQLLFSFPKFSIRFGDHFAIGGPNMSGKSTFIRQLLEEKFPGYYAEGLSIGYFAQNLSHLNPQKSIIENVESTSVQDIFTIRNLLAALAFDYQQFDKPVSILSGGERVRVSLAKVLLGDHNLLILDEPTNYLDIVTIKALESFLDSYPGAVLLVSHDQTFVKQIVDHIYQIKAKQLLAEVYQESYSDQRESQIQALKLRRDQMIQDESIPIEEIKSINEEINLLLDE